MAAAPVHILIIQVTSSLISIASSLVMTSSIAWFGSAGSSPYRRIILGLSISDILQSFAVLFGPVSVPHYDLYDYEAETETLSCQVNGFVSYAGGMAVMMYTTFLCLYYLCKLKYRMTDEAFRHTIERKLHAVIVIFSLLSGCVLIVMDAFHTNTLTHSMCTIATVPPACGGVDFGMGMDVGGRRCDPTNEKQLGIFVYVFVIGFSVACFTGIIVTMGMLYHHVFTLNQNIVMEATVNAMANTSFPTTLRGNRHRNRNRNRNRDRINNSNGNSNRDRDRTNEATSNAPMEISINKGTEQTTAAVDEESGHLHDNDDNNSNYDSDNDDENNNDRNNNDNGDDDNDESPQDRVVRLSNLYRREVMIQATAFVGVFCLVYLPMLINLLPSRTPTTHSNPSNASNISIAIAIFFYPLGGFLNILVYTRPKVTSLRREYPQCSRMRGFWIVLKAGGEVPKEIDLSLTCCQDCFRVPAWILESEEDGYDYNVNSSGANTDEKNMRMYGNMLCRLGF